MDVLDSTASPGSSSQIIGLPLLRVRQMGRPVAPLPVLAVIAPAHQGDPAQYSAHSRGQWLTWSWQSGGAAVFLRMRGRRHAKGPASTSSGNPPTWLPPPRSRASATARRLTPYGPSNFNRGGQAHPVILSVCQPGRPFLSALWVQSQTQRALLASSSVCWMPGRINPLSGRRFAANSGLGGLCPHVGTDPRNCRSPALDTGGTESPGGAGSQEARGSLCTLGTPCYIHGD